MHKTQVIQRLEHKPDMIKLIKQEEGNVHELVGTGKDCTDD